jgi:hypothetical protein
VSNDTTTPAPAKARRRVAPPLTPEAAPAPAVTPAPATGILTPHQGGGHRLPEFRVFIPRCQRCARPVLETYGTLVPYDDDGRGSHYTRCAGCGFRFILHRE